MAHRFSFALAIVGILVTGFVAVAVAGRYGEVIGKESARGDYATVFAGGNARHPSAMYVRISSKPRQRVTGNWSVTCAKGFGAGSKDGRFAGTTPEVDKVKLPMRNPDDCSLAGGGQLKNSGKITVKLFAK